MFPEQFSNIKLPEDFSNNCENYEFNSSKNGQNIIKHGFSFNELMSYSENFGALVIPLENIKGENRIVIFSILNTGNNGENLELPPSKTKGKIATLTIAKQLEDNFKFRLISSMRLSSKERNWKHQISTSVRLENLSQEDKDLFLARCHEILEESIFPNISESSTNNIQ